MTRIQAIINTELTPIIVEDRDGQIVIPGHTAAQDMKFQPNEVTFIGKYAQDVGDLLFDAAEKT